eukprot:TRINITY_DN12811_c0_g1_i3.p1 TRINITY_DN12811_c0_g1~~TRINITY_DN12811_c0_g1_i3.p1  ORF type:complete len:486 (+),score=57.98 TRINITY_DN12811_c0_g1_i3:1250-2707(+)
MECLPCDESCLECIPGGKCLECNSPYYLYMGVCIVTCPAGTYGDSLAKTCEPCYENCASCIGPYMSQCSNCSSVYLNLTNDYGMCLNLICIEEQYSNITSCIDCKFPCAACDSSESCVECEANLVNVFAEGKTKCEECPEGYVTTSKGLCKGSVEVLRLEICGDGVNMGSYECDDGNTESGDGCSKECKIEPGFDCSKGNPEVCRSVVSPYATLEVRKGNKLIIKFSAEMVSTIPCIFNNGQIVAELKDHVKIFLISVSEGSTELSWNFASLFNPLQKFTTVMIDTEIPYSTRGAGEVIRVEFKDGSLLQDEFGNYLSTEVLAASALRQMLFPKGLEIIGGVIKMSTTVTLVVVVGMSLFQSVDTSSFWTLLNMLQIISYMPMIKCTIPENFRTFLEKYLTIALAKATMPFEFLPEWLPDPKELLESLNFFEFNLDLDFYSFESFNFLYNFSDELITWISLGLFYLLANLLVKLRPNSRCTLLRV